MRCSIKSLLLFITAFCMSLALTWLPPKTGAVVLVAIAAGLRLKMSRGAWWSMVTVALLGVALGGVFVIKKSVDDTAYAGEWVPYANQLGAFVGGSLGLLLYNRKSLAKQKRIGVV